MLSNIYITESIARTGNSSNAVEILLQLETNKSIDRTKREILKNLIEKNIFITITFLTPPIIDVFPYKGNRGGIIFKFYITIATF
jgi:hypothetical protein